MTNNSVFDCLCIIDKPNERSSHSTIVLRGGGVIFPLSMLVWAGFHGVCGTWGLFFEYLPFLIGLFIIAGVSFVDDVRSLPDSLRLVAQFVAMGLMFWSLDIIHWEMWWIVLIALIVFVGATNIFNFMDGINGITAAYSFSVLLPLLLLNNKVDDPFVLNSFLGIAILGVLVFSFFNFRPKGKAKCFAGDVGSVGIAFILLFAIGKLILHTDDVTWLVFLLVYGVDGCCTIIHRLMLHEHIGEAHRKHAYQILSNEVTEWAFEPKRPSSGRLWRCLLGKAENSHVAVTLLYMTLQLAVSLGFIYLCPNTVLAHWAYLVGAGLVLVVAYVVFMKKYYHLHAEYLESLKTK